MFSLRCDYREDRGGRVITLLKNLRTQESIVASNKYELRDEVMTTGDYAISSGGYIILIERKTWEDLAASIKDKRIFENHKKMLAARSLGYRIMYLIEGREPNPENAAIKISGIPMANMMAKLDHFAMRDGVWVEYTRSAMHTAQRLLELGKHLSTLSPVSVHDDEAPIIAAAGGNIGQPEEKTVEPEIIRPIANPDEILKKKYEKSIPQMREAMLACIPGIGDKTARNMLNACTFPKLVTFSGITGPLTLNSFQTSELMALSRGERPAIVIAMLKEIKGVSEPIARQITAGFSLKQLCTRDTLTTASIADMKLPSGRRLGSKLADRISEAWSDEAAPADLTTSTSTTSVQTITDGTSAMPPATLMQSS